MSAKKYVFEKAVKVAGVRFAAGTVAAVGSVEDGKIPPGHLDSLLRQGMVTEYEEADAASRFAAAMTAGIDGPTDEDMRAAVAEIDRLRQRGAAMAVENKSLREENVLLTAEVNKLETELKAAKAGEKSAAEPEPTPDEKPADPKAEAKSEPPKIGPAKPPELKAGGKK